MTSEQTTQQRRLQADTAAKLATLFHAILVRAFKAEL